MSGIEQGLPERPTRRAPRPGEDYPKQQKAEAFSDSLGSFVQFEENKPTAAQTPAPPPQKPPPIPQKRPVQQQHSRQLQKPTTLPPKRPPQIPDENKQQPPPASRKSLTSSLPKPQQTVPPGQPQNASQTRAGIPSSSIKSVLPDVVRAAQRMLSLSSKHSSPKPSSTPPVPPNKVKPEAPQDRPRSDSGNVHEEETGGTDIDDTVYATVGKEDGVDEVKGEEEVVVEEGETEEEKGEQQWSDVTKITEMSEQETPGQPRKRFNSVVIVPKFMSPQPPPVRKRPTRVKRRPNGGVPPPIPQTRPKASLSRSSPASEAPFSQAQKPHSAAAAAALAAALSSSDPQPSLTAQEPSSPLSESTDSDSAITPPPSSQLAESFCAAETEEEYVEEGEEDVEEEEEEEIVVTDENAPELLPGEKILHKIEPVMHVHLSQNSSFVDSEAKSVATGIEGTLFVTTYRIVFMPSKDTLERWKMMQAASADAAATNAAYAEKSKSKWKKKEEPKYLRTFQIPCNPKGVSMPLASILNIERQRGGTYGGTVDCFIVVHSKLFHDFRFHYQIKNAVVPSTEFDSSSSTAVTLIGSMSLNLLEFKYNGGLCPEDIIAGAAFRDSISRHFAFNPTWRESFDDELVRKWWSVLDPTREFHRCKIPETEWRLTTVNEGFAHCQSYPETLCVPADITDDMLKKVMKFRSKGRIPVLEWINLENGAALCRCGQPSVGLTNSRCEEDEILMQRMAVLSPQKEMKIIDARPKIAAKANQLKGQGFEREEVYKNCSLEFMGIENIHKMRESLMKFISVVMHAPESTFKLRILTTKWHHHIGLLIKSAVNVFSKLVGGYSVMVHCSDGWDRTPQLAALTMLLGDPYYCKFEGFAVLIEKEWTGFGHKFKDRCEHLSSVESLHEYSPIFLQFLECVHHILAFCPTAFEFNDDYLVFLAEELYSCRFGTFLFNTPMERLKEQAVERTVPVWAYIDMHRDLFTNKDYKPDKRLYDIIRRDAVPVRLWDELYMKWRRNHSLDAEIPFRSGWKQSSP